jgi:hypothetical protein
MRRRVGSRLVAVAAVAVAALGIGIGLWISSGGSTSSADRAGSGSPVGYGGLWQKAVVGKTRIDVLSLWPKPYQHYSDGTANDCYEWNQRSVKLYNLCFKNGVLASKSLA